MPMPLQNRVTPFGEIVAVPERGTLMGNRGVLHDDAGRIVRSYQVRRWITCRTAFRGRHRQLLQPHTWTELFFLDEATAFAAGHRPCAECRYSDYQHFKAAWAVGAGVPNGADEIDMVLHYDRLEGRGAPQRKRTYWEQLASLPAGVFIRLDGSAWLLWGGQASSRPRAMPWAWEPWPGKRKRGRCSAGPCPDQARVLGPLASARAASSSSRSSPTATARCSKAERVVSRE